VLAILDMFIEAVRILHPASRASRRPISASIAVTIPVIKGLKRTLVSKTLDFSEVSSHYALYKNVYSAVESEFPNVQTCSMYVVATVIDPRFKSRVFESAEERKAAEHVLFSACMRICHPTAMAKLTRGDSKHVFDALTMETSGNCGSSRIATEDESAVGSAIGAYLLEPTLNFCADIEEYWLSNSKRWPSLAHVASLYLCVPASTKIMQSLVGLSSGHGENPAIGDAVSRQLLFIRQNLLSGMTFGVPDLDSHG
jgi:hypothetical protein